MKAIIEIDMDNEVFNEDHGRELSRILKDLASRIAKNDPSWETGRLRDINGNVVGSFEITE